MAYLNPSYYKGPRLEKIQRRAKDGNTWQAGHFCRFTDSGVIPCLAGATSIQGLFSQTQATATASSDVYVEKIASASTQLMVAVTAAGADTKAPSSLIGSNYGVDVNSCVCTLSTGDDSNESLHIVDIMNTVEGFSGNYDTSDIPGYVIITIPDSVLTAEGAGQ